MSAQFIEQAISFQYTFCLPCQKLSMHSFVILFLGTLFYSVGLLVSFYAMLYITVFYYVFCFFLSFPKKSSHMIYPDYCSSSVYSFPVFPTPTPICTHSLCLQFENKFRLLKDNSKIRYNIITLNKTSLSG